MICQHCRKKIHLVFKCKWCAKQYCTRCLGCEHHACEEHEAMRATNAETLERKLVSCKSADNRIVKI